MVFEVGHVAPSLAVQNGTESSSAAPPSPPGCPSFGQSRNRTLSATTSVIQRVPPSWAWYERVCRRPSTATSRPLPRLCAHTSASLRHVTTVKKSVSRSPCWFLNGLSTAMRNVVTATPFWVYESRGSLANRPTRIVLLRMATHSSYNPSPGGRLSI